MSRRCDRITFKMDGNVKYMYGKKNIISPYVYPLMKNIELYRQAELETFTVLDIEKAVFEAHGLTREDFFQRRVRNLRRDAKRMVTYLLYEKTRMSFKEISSYFGNKDHTSAIYNYEQFKESLKKEPNKNIQLNVVLNKLVRNGWQEIEYK